MAIAVLLLFILCFSFLFILCFVRLISSHSLEMYSYAWSYEIKLNAFGDSYQFKCKR